MTAAKQNGFPEELPAELREPPPMQDLPQQATERKLIQWLFSALMVWDPVWRGVLRFLRAVHGFFVQYRQELRELRGEVYEVRSVALAIAAKLGVELTVAVGARAPATVPPLPPMRNRVESLIEFAEEVKEATQRGEKEEGTTADEQVDHLIEKKLAEVAERERIKKLEDDAAEAARLKIEAAEQKKDRRKQLRNWAAGLLSAVASGWILRELALVHWR